jgi:hypothetical protein
MGSGIGKRAHDKALTALDRINALESGHEQILNGLTQSFELIESRLQMLEELTAAVTSVIGQDEVRDAVVAHRQAQQAARVASAQRSVETALEQGLLLKTDVLPSAEVLSGENAEEVTSKILIVGRELGEDGTALEPGRLQLPMARLVKDVQLQLAGKGPGTVIDTPNNRKFALDEIYTENPNPPAPPSAPEGEVAIEAEVAGTVEEQTNV